MTFSAHRCSQCGSALAENSLDGLCGACLLRQALVDDCEGTTLPESHAGAEKPDGDETGPPGRRCEESD